MNISHEQLSLANDLLEELVSLNEHLCSEEELKQIKTFIYVGEESLALDEFCAMWVVTAKPQLDAKSKNIIKQLFELLDLENNEIFGENTSKILEE